MRLARLLFKPKWQEKDAAVRRIAVATANDAELIAALPDLVRADPDAGVRLAALKRLNDYECWRERSTGDADNSLRSSARAAYLALLCANAAGAPPLLRQISELDTLSADEIDQVATTAVLRELRAAALGYVRRPGLLAERAISDPDPQLRLQLLERIDDASALERIAERARKTDKAVNRRARERLEALRISAGDVTTIADKARSLCERVESLMRTPHAAMETELSSIDSAWAALGETVPADLTARYRGAIALALRALDMLQNPQIPPNHNAPDIVPAETQQAQVTAQVLTSQARFDVALATAQAAARAEREQQQARCRQIEDLLPQFAAAIDAGDSASTHRLYRQIHDIVQTLSEVSEPLQKQLSPLEARYAEMKHWQHWANAQRRRVLCADIETLASAGLHPDAVATRVREARDEWQRLDVSEGIEAETAQTQGIARRFHASCHRALRPTKVYFSKLKEVRKSHSEEIDALLARTAAVTGDSSDWSAIAASRSEASTALRSLDGVDPRNRTVLAKQLKNEIARLTGFIDAHEHEIENARKRLIEQAVALAERGDKTTLAREARDLQKRWTALGNSRRAVDQRQWREFRAACDSAFGRLDAERKQHEAESVAVKAQAQNVLAELEALATDEALLIDEIRAKLREVDARWQALASDDRALVQRQRQAHDAIAMRLRDAARRQRLARYSAAMEKYTFIRSMETGIALPQARWDELAVSAPEFDVLLAARHARAESLSANAGDVGVDESDSARDIIVRLEYVGGIESSPEDRQRRMNHQVQRLSSRMRDAAAAASPDHELSALLAAWFAQMPQPLPLEDRFKCAALAAIDTLP